ncbi:MAG: YhgE/Pip domain-containing protein [Nocardioidaceae bacterium]
MSRLRSFFATHRLLVGALLVPTVFGALVLWSLADRAERADEVPAAVVNLDRPVNSDGQVVAAGRLLAAGLTSPRHPDRSGLGWQLTDPADARTGLREGRYYAVVTIPRGFSKTLAGISGSDPRAATLQVRSNDSSSALAGRVGRQVTQVAAQRLGRRVTTTYLRGMLERTGELKGRLGDAAGGAAKVARGAGNLRGGAARLGRGAGSLADGLHRLGDGAAKLKTGADALHRGTHELHQGATRLDAGTHRLAGGLATLSTRTRDLPRQTRRLADGASRVSAGVGPYTELVKGWAQACAADPTITVTQAKLCALTEKAAGPGGRNADDLAAGARELAAGADTLAKRTPQLTGAITDAAGGADRLADGSRTLARGSDRLDSAAGRLASGARRLAAGTRPAGAGAGRLAVGGSRLAAGAAELSGGSQTLAGGLRKGAVQVPDSPHPAAQAKVVADPVTTTAASLNRVHDGTTLLVPAVLAFALWLGAFVTYLVREALPARALRAARPAWRLTLQAWLPALAAGVAQAAVLFATVALLGADLASPLGVAGFMVVAAAVFAALNQAFVAAFGPRRGWIVSIGFAVLQSVSLGGLVPIDTAPGPLQVLNKVLPVARAADGLDQLTLGGHVGAPGAALAVLLRWGVAALVVTTLAARRRQRLDLDDVRRRVSAVPPLATMRE